jgi:predicted MPP superfamily phosphohydrolase
MHSPLFLVLIACVLLLLDAYLLHGLRAVLVNRPIIHKKRFLIFYWVFCIGMAIGLIICVYMKLNLGVRASFLVFFFVSQTAKLCFLPFMIIDDVRRYLIKQKNKKQVLPPAIAAPLNVPAPITRSAFLMKAGILATSAPVIAMGAGLVTRMGCFDYRVRRLNLYLPNLPKKFDGLRLGQISDIHSASFHKRDRVHVRGGIEMLTNEKPDLIFFTGDLVNDLAHEIERTYDIFEKIKAPLGVYSILGNHDYGDYSHLTGAPRQKNREDMLRIHKNYGWNLLLNENRRLKIEGEEIGILGVENWGMLSRFPKYGRMDLAVKNTDDLPVKLLLSHDPSHWRGEVVDKYKQIDMVFSGHTHGMQFGVRTDTFEWSPIEYLYGEWAGLYREAQQQIYVNVGFGYIGFPGRVGILPEITIFTLKSGPDPQLKST